MGLVWPMVGRARELEHVAALLRGGGRGVMLAGPAGVGKTRLASECMTLAASHGFVPLRVGATEGSASLPFGAFASFVPALSEGSARAEVLRQIADAVIGRGGGSPVAVLVDDAHLLDGASAALTHLLVGGEYRVFVLATLRSGEPTSDAVVALWKDGLAERLELAPLGSTEVAELVALALGGPVDGATAHLLWQRTQGNALFLRELVLAALQSDALRNEDGVWRLRGTLAISARLQEIVESRLGDLSEPVRRAVAVLALGEPLGVEVFARIDAETDLEVLERGGLVTIEQSNRRLDVRLAHPLYAQIVRARMSALQARAVARALADALQAAGWRRRGDTLKLATLRLDGAGSFGPEIMLRAATTARELFDLPLAERLAEAAVGAGAGFDAGLLLGQLHWLQGRAAQANDQLGDLVELAVSDAQRVALAIDRVNVLEFGLNRSAEAMAVADEADAAISEPSCRDLITAYRARGLSWSGQHTAAIDVVRPLLARGSGPALIFACIAAGTSMAVAGQTSDAITATERGLAEHLALTGPPLPFSPTWHRGLRSVALSDAGRLLEAEAFARSEYDKAVSEESIEGRATSTLFLAYATLLQGRLATAARWGQESVGEWRQIGWPLMLRTALTMHAHALALQGLAAPARVVLTEIDALGVPATHMYGPEVLRARAWIEVADGSLPDGHAFLEEAGAMARTGGAFALETRALHDLVRLGRGAPVAPRLRELTAIVEGPFVAAATAHAEALSGHDAAGLSAASVTFEQIGAILLAAEAAADSAVAWRRALEPRKATAAEQRSGALTARCEGARTPALTAAAPARAALTPRELEIARLAAKGLANKEIAARLFLSHRTVENKLHTCYAKLGAEGRADLARALEHY